MSIPLLPRWNLQPNRPSFYDTDSATLLELASKMQAAFNEMVEDYNKFVESTNSQMQQFMESTNADQEAFQVGIRQEFQDFINICDLKIAEMQRTLDDTAQNMEQSVEDTLRNIEDRTRDEINEAITEGKITMIQTYDSSTQSLNILVNGGV